MGRHFSHLLVISSLVIISVCGHVFGQVSDYYSPTLSRLLLQTGQSNRNQSSEKDHKGTKSKDRERSREGELPSTASQMAARDRAIQQKRREIDEVVKSVHKHTHTLAEQLAIKRKEEER